MGISVVFGATNVLNKVTFLCRVKTNPKNAINEHLLPGFLDFVVWGHEHECLIDPLVQFRFSQASYIFCLVLYLMRLYFHRKFQKWGFILHSLVLLLPHH